MAGNQFRNLRVTFNSYTGVKKPDMTDKEKFYKIYSPKKFKLRPRDDIYLDLKFNIETSKELHRGLVYYHHSRDLVQQLKTKIGQIT